MIVSGILIPGQDNFGIDLGIAGCGRSPDQRDLHGSSGSHTGSGSAGDLGVFCIIELHHIVRLSQESGIEDIGRVGIGGSCRGRSFTGERSAGQIVIVDLFKGHFIDIDCLAVSLHAVFESDKASGSGVGSQIHRVKIPV